MSSSPAAIAITAPSEALPCGLATTDCASQANVLSCVDRFFSNDKQCGKSVDHQTFLHFTALPVPNDCREACIAETPPCDLFSATELRYAADIGGNLLLPVSWSGVLLPSVIPVPRLVRVSLRSPLGFAIPVPLLQAVSTGQAASDFVAGDAA